MSTNLRNNLDTGSMGFNDYIFRYLAPIKLQDCNFFFKNTLQILFMWKRHNNSNSKWFVGQSLSLPYKLP